MLIAEFLKSNVTITSNTREIRKCLGTYVSYLVKSLPAYNKNIMKNTTKKSPSPATKKKATKKPNGRPTKKRETHTQIAHNLAKTGHTIEEIAEIAGVCKATIYNWFAKDKKFLDAIKEGKPAAIKRMENSLFHRGVGYSHPEEKIFVHNIGKGKVKVTKVKTTQQYPPDTAAAFIWLKNVNPENWRDKVELEVKTYLHKELGELPTEDLRSKAMELANEIVGKRTPASQN